MKGLNPGYLLILFYFKTQIDPPCFFSQVFFEHFFYLLCQMACPIWRIENLIIEDGKVECQTQSDRMRGGHFRLGYVKCLLVCLLRVFYCSCLWFAVANKERMEKKKRNIVNISIGMCTYGNCINWLGNTQLKFRFSKNAKKIWGNLPIRFDMTK